MKSPESATKIFIDANRLLDDAFKLGQMVLDSGFRPDVLIALWRGGAPVGIAIQELLAFKGIAHDHFPLKTRHYAGIEQRRSDVEIEGLEAVVNKISTDSRLLIVDDVFDTGLTLYKLTREIRQRSDVSPEQIKVATVWFKPANNQTRRNPDYFLHQTDRWIVFPHEIVGLNDEEINRGKMELTSLKAL